MNERSAGSGRQIEAMTAEQAEVVAQNVAVERLTQLSAQRTATDTAGQAAENGAGERAEYDA
ncbi:hypothetical protein D3C80_1688050 [compost metagenome]